MVSSSIFTNPGVNYFDTFVHTAVLGILAILFLNFQQFCQYTGISVQESARLITVLLVTDTSYSSPSAFKILNTSETIKMQILSLEY